MKVLDASNTPLEAPEHKRLVEPPDPLACPSCGGWGYPKVDLAPVQNEAGAWLLRVQSKCCRACSGSGYNLALVFDDKIIDAGRAYHNNRVDQLGLWAASEVRRKLEESS